MAEIYIKKYISLTEYFDKWGFDDGDEDHGWQYQNIAIEIINKNFKDTNITAERYDAGSSHNNCRIMLLKEDKEIEFDNDDGETIFSSDVWEEFVGPKNGKKFAGIMEKCDEEFETAVLDDISKIINTPNKDLPLLVGTLKDENAIKLFNRLLKK